ncbi:uncharacterized protein [Dysidea avara]|uniref:uncharacterized protein isoform X2 n=1 Tax=Dysidea avara TaxID=196820 RepID=UPI00332BE69E
MAAMTAAETFRHYQVDLLRLPMNDVTFVNMLDREDFFHGNSKASMLAEKTEAEKSAYFLDNIIKRNIDLYFDKLLTTMQSYDGPEGAVAKLAIEIKSKMGQGLRKTTGSKRQNNPDTNEEYSDDGSKAKSKSRKKTKGTCTSDKPDYPNLVKYLSEVVDWKTFGTYLLPSDGSAADLEKISNTYGKDVTECQQALIRLYLKKGDISWEKVVEALKDADYNVLATKIENKFLQ